MEIKGKKVLVTGGAARIGRSISMAFAAEGAKLIIHFNKSKNEAETLLSEIGGEKKGHLISQCNLNDIESVSKFISGTPPVDILINNASVYNPLPLLKEKTEDAMEQFRVNFWVPLKFIAFFAKQKIREGCIINILDQRIARNTDQSGSYSLSKKLLAEATIALAIQLAPKIRVNAVAPGAILPPVGMEKLHMRKHIKNMPLKKAPLPVNIAETCIFLVRQDSITGQIVYVDGGEHLL